jgi:hypothetical protein
MDEQWRDVEGYEGHYQVSDYGRVKSLKFGRELILKGSILWGYHVVSLQRKGGKVRGVSVHRLVAFAFLPPDSERPYVNHKDGQRANNHVDNLEWCTASENVLHMYYVLRNNPNAITKETKV